MNEPVGVRGIVYQLSSALPSFLHKPVLFVRLMPKSRRRCSGGGLCAFYNDHFALFLQIDPIFPHPIKPANDYSGVRAPKRLDICTVPLV